LAGPIAINSFGVAFTGMEHALHMAASLAIVHGLQRALIEERLTAVLLLGLFLSPALRLEGLALGLLAAGVVWWAIGLRAAIVCAVLTLLPVVVFVTVLTGLGLDPLPESVQAKLQGEDEDDLSWTSRFLGQFQINLSKRAGQVLAFGAIILTVLAATLSNLKESGPRWISLAVVGAVFAHLLFAQIGWMDRYEGYIWASLAAGLVIARGLGPRLAQAGAIAVVLAGGGYAYWSSWTQNFPWNIRAIHVQPAQSARFAQEFAKVPVAVNDLGLAAWRNPNYVLDLYGLASAEARELRLGNAAPGWAAPLAEARGVKLVMIYDTWLEDAVGPEWVRLGWLRLSIPSHATSAGFLGHSEVSYYATSPEFVPELEAALEAWVPTLPLGANWVEAE